MPHDEPAGPLGEIGVPGLDWTGGQINEEFLPQLRWRQGLKIYKEMRDNSPVVGASLAAQRLMIRQVEWSVKPASEDPKDIEAADFLESAMGDMEQGWDATIDEVLSMLWAGFSAHEIVYKRRHGHDPDPENQSKLTDGRIGWRKLPIRAQETIWEWTLSDTGEFEGLVQSAPPAFGFMRIPAEKLLLFRLSTHKGNPEGRALDPETPIPTPDGWRKLDDLHEGDKVFDEAGCIRYVTGRAEWEDRPCREVVFSNGTSIVADIEHTWITKTQSERMRRLPGVERSTSEIERAVKNRQGVSNHGITWAGPLDYPTQEQLLDPYYLGLWLGDGDSRGSSITCHADDVEETASHIRGCGYRTAVGMNGKKGGLGRKIRVTTEKWSSTCPSRLLGSVGVKNNKHIPRSYLRGSISQRLSLLAGLMDSDGHVDRNGRCEFSNTNYSLIEGVFELVQSLGIGARVSSKVTTGFGGRPSKSGKPGIAWLVKFTPTFIPFRLQRKAARCKENRSRTYHYITEVKPAKARRTVCIEVDSPSGLFLAGESMVPTHNSGLRNAYRPWFFGKRMEEIEAIGIERDLAGLPFALIPGDVLAATKGDDKKIADSYRKMVTGIKNNKQAGFVSSSAREDGHLIYEIGLLSSSGKRNFDTGKVVERYNRLIAMTMLADFILLGHESVGSFALADSKTNMFGLAVGAVLDIIAEEFNKNAIPRLFALNPDLPQDDLPEIVHGDVETQDPAVMAEAISKLIGVGVLSPSPELANFVLRTLGAPELPDDAEPDEEEEDPDLSPEPPPEEDESDEVPDL